MIRLALHSVLVGAAFAGLAAAELGQPVNLTQQLWRRDDVTFDQVFTAYSRADRGGCQAYLNQDGLLDNWHQEAIDMVEAALEGLDSYGNTGKGRKVEMAARTFFGLSRKRGGPIPEDLTPDGEVYGKFVRISEFLSGKGTVHGGPIPWLFCDSTFLTPKSFMDQAQDMFGKPIAGPDGAPILIGSEYAAHRAKGEFPFWSEDIHTYIFDDPAHGNNHCAATAHDNDLAVTVDTKHKDLNPNDGREARVAVTLCPAAFNDPLSQETITSKTIKAKMPLSDVQPRSLTLLHEIFHALFSTEFDSGPHEHYGVFECIKRANNEFSGKTALENPDNWCYFALVMYHLYNQDSKGAYWDFSKGSATSVR